MLSTKYDSDAKRDKYLYALRSVLEGIKVTQAEGVSICFGPDLLRSVGVCHSREFFHRPQVQSLLEFLRSAMMTPAEMIGLRDVSQIKNGFLADLLALESNPLEEISLLEKEE